MGSSSEGEAGFAFPLVWRQPINKRCSIERQTA